MGDIGKILILAGVVLILVGGCIFILGKIPGMGKLAGDILIKRENFTFYFPLMTCVIVSIILSLILFLLNRK